jgi:hypothetical protein
VHLPHGTKLVYLAFLFEPQHVYRAMANHFLSARYRFPAELEELQFNLVGREGLVLKGGLLELGPKQGYTSTTLRTFITELQREQLYARAFEEYFPGGDHVGFEQVLLLRCDYYPLPPEGAQLNLTLKYSAVAKERMIIRAYPVTQRRYEYSPKSKWTYKELS